MNYEDYSAVDFLKDEFFVQWVTKDDPSTDEYWQRWLSAHPQKINEINQAKAILNSLSLKNHYQIDQQQYEKMLDRVVIHQQKQLGQQKVRGLEPKSMTKWWLMAASLVLLLSFTGIFYLNLQEDAPSIPVAELQTKIIPAGAKYTLRLADGTMVKLNSNSRLVYPDLFTDSIRKVYLEGEAFFEVERDVDRPFIIETAGAITEVLGTSFNVKAYEADPATEVSVVSGSVKVKNDFGNERVLAPYEQGIAKLNTEEILISQFNVKQVIGWKDGILLFEKVPFEEVVRKLENWYGVEVEIEPELSLKGVYSGEFRNETLEQVLEGLAYSYEFKFKLNDKNVYVY